MKKKIVNFEIDILEIIIDIWNSKLKIAAITLLFIFVFLVLNLALQPIPNSKTEIKPINFFEVQKYLRYNLVIQENEKSVNRFNQIDEKYLLELYITDLLNRKVLFDAFEKFEVIERDQYQDSTDYLNAIEKEALKVNFVPPIKTNSKRRGEKPNWTIEYKTRNKLKWKEILRYVNNEINKNTKEYLISNYNVSMEDLESLINLKIDEIENKIRFAKEDYEQEMLSLLVFLKEQAIIAREINLETNSNSDMFNSNMSTYSVGNQIKRNTYPYYLRGFKVIEKEIELIENRVNKDAFTNGLQKLKKQKRDLKENKSLKRIESAFSKLQIQTENNFTAASIDYKNTKYYVGAFSLIKIILIGGAFGIISGMFYILISSAIRQRK